MIRDYSGYIFDLDGTIYLGSEVIPGAVETIRYLQSQNRKILYLTNKTIDSRHNYLEKLRGFDIDVDLEDILSPTLVTISYLKKNYKDKKIYLIGEPVVKKELEQAGIKFSHNPEETDIVVVSWDRDFHYNKLNFAYQAIKSGAQVIATNPDRTCPIPGGEVPDCGGMIGAIEGTTGEKIDVIIGKPSVYMAQTALEILSLEAAECLMVGDRIETDIKMGNLAGISSALVLSGVTNIKDLETTNIYVDYVLRSVADIQKV